MREGWTTILLKEVSDIVTGSTPPTNSQLYYGEAYPFVSPANIDDRVYISRTAKTLSAKGFAKSRPIPKNAVLFTCIGSTIGKLCISHTELATNKQINAVIPHRQKTSALFLYYALSKISYRIKSIAGTQAIPIINKSTFETTILNLPPIEEQKKIAEILRTCDQANERIEALIRTRKQKKRIMQRDLFAGKFISSERRGKHVALYALADWHNGSAFKSIDLSPCGRPVIKIAELKAGIISSTAFTQGEHNKKILVTRGDLLFSWSGNPDTSIDAFIRDGEEGWLNQHIFRVIPKPHVDKKYLYQFLRYIKNRLAYVATGKQFTGLGHITKADMQRTYIDLPDIGSQKRIADILSDFDILINGLMRQKELLQFQKRGLMQKLLGGHSELKLKRRSIDDF